MSTDPPQAETLGYWLRRLRDQDRRRRGMPPVVLALSRHEIEHVVREAPWESLPPVGYDEDEPYRQHPTEHTLREEP